MLSEFLGMRLCGCVVSSGNKTGDERSAILGKASHSGPYNSNFALWSTFLAWQTLSFRPHSGQMSAFFFLVFLRLSLALSPRLESAVVQSWLTATSASQVQVILLLQAPE